MIRNFFLFICCVSSAHANWEDLIKPCENKHGNHSIAEIDFIYMVNLKVRPQKWQKSLNQLLPYGINPYRFDAINGWDLDPILFKNLGCPELIPDMKGGKIGCALSFLSVFTDAYYSDYKTVWIMEDDIEVIEDPRQLSELIRELDQLVPDWDILYTDIDTKDFYGNRVPCLAICPRPNFAPESLEFYLRKISINEKFQEIGMRYGCYSMVVRRSGLKKILDYYTTYRLFMPIDMDLVFIPGLKQIRITKDVVSTLPGIKSDTTYHYYVNDMRYNQPTRIPHQKSNVGD